MNKKKLRARIIDLELEIEALNNTIRQQAEELMDLSDKAQIAAASLVLINDMVKLQEQHK